MDKINEVTPQTNVECILIREGGTRDVMGGIEYHFAPQADGAHVCGIANPDHVDRYLSIPEAYRLYRGEAQPVAAPIVPLTVSVPAPVEAAPAPAIAEPAPAPVAPASTTHPDSFDIGGVTYTLTDISARARDGLGMSDQDWAELSADARADFIDEVLDELAAVTSDVADAAPPPDEPAPAAPAADADRETLSAAYKARFGKPPHYRWSTDKIRDALAE